MNFEFWIVILYCIGFTLCLYMLIGWSRVFYIIKKLTGRRGGGSGLVLLWGGLITSLTYPFGSVLYPHLGLTLIMTILLVLLVIWTLIRYLRIDKKKYIKRAVLGDDFMQHCPLDSLDFEDLMVLGRRQRMVQMFEEFKAIQLQKNNNGSG